MKLLPVEYLGSTAMDKRFSTPMLPWIIAEIRRRNTVDKICVGVEDGTVQAYDQNFEMQFAHKIQHMLRFSRAIQDPRSFMYLLKDPEKPLLYCHLFRASRPDDVAELFKQMREQGGIIGQQAGGYGPQIASSPTTQRRRMPQRSMSSAATLTSLCADISPSSSHFFEVLYIGKIKVSHKKVPDTFIDDALAKFKDHEAAKLKEKLAKEAQRHNNARRESQDSITSDSSSTDSCSTQNLTPQNEAPSEKTHKQHSASTKSDSTAQQESILHISEDRETGNSKNVDEPVIYPVIRTERSDSVVSDSGIPLGIKQIELDKELEQRVQRTTSESALNSCGELHADNSINNNKFYSKSYENVPLTSSDYAQNNTDYKNTKLYVQSPLLSGSRRFGSAETLPTVAEDAANTTAAQEETAESKNTADINAKKVEHTDHNRTMVFQVGRFDLRLISPDRKQILLHKQLKDVATCIQGIENPAYFGFICRELNHDTFMGYIFKCESESVAIDVVQAIKQSFNSTNDQFKRDKAAVVSCEHCPMVWYHKLCAEVENQNDRKTQAIIFKRISFLDEEEQNTILAKFRGAEADSTREQNEFLMMLLRAHCEAKQTRHIHDTAENRSEFLNQYLGGSTIFMKAKRSLTNSFDHLLKRKGSRDDFGPQLKELNLNSTREVSPAAQQTLDIPSSENENSFSRSRTSTMSSANGDDRSPTGSIAGDSDKNQLKSPMMDIFFKVGSSPKSPSKDSGDVSDKSPQVTSWRQEMFKKVVTPNKSENEQNEKKRKRSREELRDLWKTAIRQALLLKRMEKENDRLTARQEESAVKRIKLEYDEISPCPRDVVHLWDHYTKKDTRIVNHVDKTKLLQALRQGVPRSKRGEVWQFFRQQYCLQQPPFDSSNHPHYSTPYEELLKQLTSHQHAILIDLGRTFPNHTYYSSPLGPGQLALFNILKAYSLLDPEVGYCQGLSFVAGVLLLHMAEDEAFFLLRHLMFRRGMRELYLPDMEALQVSLYQLSRLLHDKLPDLYEHFNRHDVAPTLYAAPWILTVFASQFPLGFVARVFDVIFLEDPNVIFRVIIALLNVHKEKLLELDSFEEIMDYLKNTLPQIDRRTMDDVMREVFSADYSQSLAEYRVEYHVLQEEMASVRPQLDSLAKLEQQNKQLLEQNQRLMEQLEIAASNSKRLEQTRSIHQATINRLESQVRSLEVTVNTLGHFVNTVIEKKIDIEIPGDVRRIVSQIALSERRNNNVPNMKKIEPQKYMVKSLSMGKLGLNFNKTNNQDSTPVIRSQSVNQNIGLKQELKQETDTARRNSILNSVNESLSKIETQGHRGYPLRVIDDGDTYEPPTKPTPTILPTNQTNQNTTTKSAPKYPLKSALSQPNLGAKSGFFANSHNHIQQQRLQSLALQQGYKDVNSLILELTDKKIQELKELNNNPIEKCVSLPLNVKTSAFNDSNTVAATKIETHDSLSGTDSGISTPVSPVNSDSSTTSQIPLFDSDVQCTFNGTTKLKSIRTGIKCAKP